MPNWKKVITSGSDAVLNEITSSGGILTSQDIMPDADNTLSLGSSTRRFQLNGGTPVTVTGSGTANTITRFNGATEVENSTITNTDLVTTIVHDNDTNDIFIVSGSNGELLKVTDEIGDQLLQVNDGSGITHFEVSSSGTLVAQNLEYTNETFVLTYDSQSGNISFFSSSIIANTYGDSDVTEHINTLGILSSSAQIASEISGAFVATSASIAADIASIDSSVTLQDATDNGSTTTNDITLSSEAKLIGTQASTTQEFSIIEKFLANPAAESGEQADVRIVNNLAGANKWATITLTDCYQSDRTTAITDLGDNPFDGTSAFSQFYQNTAGDPMIIQIDLPNQINWSAWVGIVFGNESWRAKSVKIETFRNGAWQTECNLTNQSSHIVSRKVANNNGDGVTKIKYTLDDIQNTTNHYIRILSLFNFNYRTGAESYGGVHYIEKYKNSEHYSNILPATDSTYDLGSSAKRYANVYTDDITIDGWGSVSSSLSDIQTSIDTITTPVQVTVDCKTLSSGWIPWSAIADLQPNPSRAFTTWIAPNDGFLDRVVVSPEQANTSNGNARINFAIGGTNQGTTQTEAMSATGGTHTTFTFGSANYSFSAGDRLSIQWDKISNTADLYNIMVVFRLDN